MFFDLENTYITDRSVAEKQEIPREYAYDFTKQEIIMENGSPKIVEGVHAIKIWIYKCLKVQRGRFPAYSFNYGQDYEDIIGETMTYEVAKAESKRMTEEALKPNKNILSLSNFEYQRVNDTFVLSFIANTLYGTLEMEVNV